MKELKIFENAEFGQIRTIQLNNDTYFMASDVAKALGYMRPADAVVQHCRATVKHSTPISGKMQEVNYIKEGDIYRLITKSKLPSAEKFESWVFDEVLPQIRQTGGYIIGTQLEELMTSPDTIMHIATQWKAEREERERLQIENDSMKPKANFADAVADSDGTIPIGDLAKILKGNGLNIGRNRLFEKMRNDGYLIKQEGTEFNSPTQKAMEMCLFRVKISTRTEPNGTVSIDKTTKVTGKGQIYFINRYADNKESVGQLELALNA